MYFPTLFLSLFAYTITPLLTADRSHGQLNEEILSVFQDGNQSYFNRLTADEQGRWVYIIDAVDYLYQLSSDLELEIKHPTSQSKPSDCSSSSSHSCSDESKRKYINDNQVLVLDHQNQQLISCSSYFPGLCQAHDTENISNVVATGPERAVPTNSAQPIVAFIAPTLLGNASTPASVLHVAFDIASDELKMFKFKTTVRNAQRERFLSYLVEITIYDKVFMRAIYGFNDGNSGYVLVRRNSDWGLPIDTLKTKSAFVMKVDPENGNYSYSTFVLTCKDYFQILHDISSTTEYYSTKLKNAYIYENKPELDCKLKTDEKVLFTLFGTYYVHLKNKSRRTDGFAVCMHRLNEVHYDRIRKYDVLDGSLVYSHQGRDIIPTGIAVTSVNNYTVLLIGTRNGHLHKISVKGFDSPDTTIANNYADVVIDEGSAINSHILYNSTMNYIYAMTKEKIVKIKMYNCEKYNTSNSCLLARDPHCGWCSPGGKCSTKTECTDKCTDNDIWSSIDQLNSGIIVIPRRKILLVFFYLYMFKNV